MLGESESNFVLDANGNKETYFPVVVVDTSFFMSAILCSFSDDEVKSAADFIEELISKNGQIVVPQIFWFEVGNVLLNAAKPKKNGGSARITKKQVLQIENLINELPIYTDLQPDIQTRMRIRELAQEYDLSYYDASYLELSQRKNLVLKTLDKDLQSAANRA